MTAGLVAAILVRASAIYFLSQGHFFSRYLIVASSRLTITISLTGSRSPRHLKYISSCSVSSFALRKDNSANRKLMTRPLARIIRLTLNFKLLSVIILPLSVSLFPDDRNFQDNSVSVFSSLLRFYPYYRGGNNSAEGRTRLSPRTRKLSVQLPLKNT